MRIASEALPFVLPPALASLILLAFQWGGLAALLAVTSAATGLFFRIPQRSPEADADTILAPANGRVTNIAQSMAPEIGSGPFHQVSIFLSVFDVHVQRAPVSGEVVASNLKRGRKVAAFRADAGEVNESLLTIIRSADGETLAVRQIAGLVARRIVTYLDVGQRVQRGELMGLIKFGSRVDLLLPEAYELSVCVGDHVTEGVTPIARARRRANRTQDATP